MLAVAKSECRVDFWRAYRSNGWLSDRDKFPSAPCEALKTIGFIGAGKMAQALAGGIARDFSELNFMVCDPSEDALQIFSEAVASRAQAVASTAEVFERSECVIIAVKPQHAAEALKSIDASNTDPLVISIMAGVSISSIQELTSAKRIVRVMPNTPSLIGEGAAGIAAGEQVSESDLNQVIELFQSVGKVVTVAEDQIDAVTGVSGSGPAYVFRLIESLVEGGTAENLPREIAMTLAVQTVLGAARLVQESGEEPAVLRDRVTSPGGTTLAALKSLEADGFDQAIVAAVSAATARSKELAKG